MSDPEEDVLAAEFVLGTLDSEERVRAERRLLDDVAFGISVAGWEHRLAPLLEGYPEIAPPPGLLAGVLSRLSDPLTVSAAGAPTNILVLERSVRRWRRAAAGALAIAAAMALWIAVAPAPAQSSRFVAVLQKDSASPAMLLDVDVGARTASLRQVSTSQPVDKSYELWLINPEVGGPRSLGVIRPKGLTTASLASYDAAVIARATYAVTVEPVGGSPNGAPSSPPILSGKLVGADSN